MFKHFREEEIVNPVFDSNPANSWDEMPERIQSNLQFTLMLLAEIRDIMHVPIIFTSTWRPKDRIGKPHKGGYAVDFQFPDAVPDSAYLDFMREIAEHDFNVGVRAILEWRGRRPWIHFESGWRKWKYGDRTVLLVAFPKKNKMIYRMYEDKLPQSYLRS